MSQNLVVNGVTYRGVDSIEMQNDQGETVPYFDDAVRYVKQNLTDEQKAQARENIGIVGTGQDGKTPVKGEDYWTEEDKTEMVNDVLAALPIGEGVRY